jgi:hypothetical protein
VKLLSVSSAFRRIWKPGTTVSATQRTRKTGERERERNQRTRIFYGRASLGPTPRHTKSLFYNGKHF